MLDLSKDIYSLSSFKRKTGEFLHRMKESGDPVVLTVNGKAELVVQDAAAYQRLLELAGLVDDRQFLRASLADIEAGRTRPMREALGHPLAFGPEGPHNACVPPTVSHHKENTP